jgi:hypothetical protein
MRFTLSFSLLALLLTVAGCTKFYKYEVRGVVLDVETGKPVEGVTVILKDYFETTTDSAGKFQGKFKISYGGFSIADEKYTGSSKYKLQLTKDGYADESVDITPVSKPSTNPVEVVVHTKIYPKGNKAKVDDPKRK